jgi:hypothetical protein
MATRKSKKGGTAAGAPLGSGKNFAKIEREAAAHGARNPAGVAYAAGKKKYGKKGMAKLAAMGRKRKGK